MSNELFVKRAPLWLIMTAFTLGSVVWNTPVAGDQRTANNPHVPSLSLEQALTRLEQQNLDLAESRARIEQTRALVKQAQAPLLPKLTATGSYVRNNKEVRVGLGDAADQLPAGIDLDLPNILIQPLDAWTAAGNVQVPLWVPTAWHDLDAAQAGQRASEAARQAIEQRVRAGFLQLAYGARALEEVVHASERAIALAEEQAQSAERRVQAGTAAPLDVLRARTERVSRESDRERARADLEQAQLALGVLLGEANRIRVVTPSEVPRPSATASPEAVALERRPELSALAAQAEANRARVSSAKARFWPQLSATGSLFVSDEPYPTGDHSGWRVSVDLMIPLYDGGFRYGKRREAEADLLLTETATARQRIAIQEELANAERELRVARERLRLSEVRLQLADDAASSARRSFEAGVATTLDVLDANNRLYQAEVAIAAERARLSQARVELMRARGEL